MKHPFASIAVVVALAPAVSAQPARPQRVDIVAVAGCLRETTPETWMLEQAGDPVGSHANAPSLKELPVLAKLGKNQFQLTGVTIFNLPAHRGQTVLVKGLLNKATPVSRLNLTSVTRVSAECPPK